MGIAPANSLFARLRAATAAEWGRYVAHPFVLALGDGSLPERCFRHYLGQDYLFLIHFARAYALAAYKAESLADIRAAAETLRALCDVEMRLHVQYCAGWGLSEADMEALPEAPETMAYTRYVLERGMAGDVLDLHVALAPCVIGYAEIGQNLLRSPAARRQGNPYVAWIDMYAGEEYQAVARTAVAQLDRLAERRLTPARLPDLARSFAEATRLEAAFWQMGLDAPL
jgi:thiaminase/transcriptional activator TenA